MLTEPIYKIAFSMLTGVNAVSGRRILDIVGSEENFFTLPSQYLGVCSGSPLKSYRKIIEKACCAKLKTKSDL